MNIAAIEDLMPGVCRALKDAVQRKTSGSECVASFALTAMMLKKDSDALKMFSLVAPLIFEDQGTLKYWNDIKDFDIDGLDAGNRMLEHYYNQGLHKNEAALYDLAEADHMTFIGITVAMMMLLYQEYERLADGITEIPPQ